VWVGIEFTSDALLYLNSFSELKKTITDINHGIPISMRPEPKIDLTRTRF
jgi:hypothetical protein